MLTYAKEVIVHEIDQISSDQQLSAAGEQDSATTKKSDASSATHVEFVYMSDVIRRLLNIDISVISTVDCTAITDTSHL